MKTIRLYTVGSAGYGLDRDSGLWLAGAKLLQRPLRVQRAITRRSYSTEEFSHDGGYLRFLENAGSGTVLRFASAMQERASCGTEKLMS